MVEGNAQPKVGTRYSVPSDSSLIIVAIPETNDVQTELTFEYWVDETEYSGPLLQAGLSADDELIIMIAAGAGAGIILIVVIIICVKFYKKR